MSLNQLKRKIGDTFLDTSAQEEINYNAQIEAE
jgi:hypothetical protein